MSKHSPVETIFLTRNAPTFAANRSGDSTNDGSIVPSFRSYSRQTPGPLVYPKWASKRPHTL